MTKDNNYRTKKRGRDRSRDSGHTKKLLINAVGEVLQKEGWQALGINKIAQTAEIDKKMIYWYFQSYENLLTAYLKEKDFYSEKLNLSQDAQLEKQTLQEAICKIFKEHFHNFSGDKEFQSLIYGQISGTPALSKFSLKKETWESEIARCTDSFFKGSIYNFKAILALLIGGVYYLSLHAEKNTTTVFGIDLSQENDKEVVTLAITQIINLVWDKATIQP